MKNMNKLMVIAIAFVAAIAPSTIFAQRSAVPASPDAAPAVMEQLPTLAKGEKEMYMRVKYPMVARENGVQGTVQVRVQIDETGKIIQSEIGKGIGAGCDEEALRVVRLSAFMPGILRGKPVTMWLTVPVSFKMM